MHLLIRLFPCSGQMGIGLGRMSIELLSCRMLPDAPFFYNGRMQLVMCARSGTNEAS